MGKKKRKGAAYRKKKQARRARLEGRSARIAAQDAAHGPGGLIGRIASIGTPDFVYVIDGGAGPIRVRAIQRPRPRGRWIGARLQHARSVATASRVGASATTEDTASARLRQQGSSMTDNMIVPCLWFEDQAEAAAALYTSLLPGGRVIAVSRYPESGENPSSRPPGSVLTVDFEVGGRRMTALNGGPMFRPNPSISFFLHADTAAEAGRLYGLLLEGGDALMPLGRYPWSERYAWVEDRFGVSWQIITGRRSTHGDTVVPCLMFANALHGRAAEALRFYAQVFPAGEVTALENYGPGEGPEHTTKHGRAILAGQELIAMDAHGEHGFTFDEGLSLQVMCADQAEVDHFWDALSVDGSPSVCGWLEDRFGVSWQVVPATIVEWMTTGDGAARGRAFGAMMKMRKPDIAALEAALRGD